MAGVSSLDMNLGSKSATSANRLMTVGRICAQDLKCIVFVLFLSDAQYITCKMQNCSEATRSKPFPGYIDHNSLIVQGDYVFVQVQNTLFSYLFYYFILSHSIFYYFLLHSFACVCMCVSLQLLRQHWIHKGTEWAVAVCFNANCAPLSSGVLLL